MEIDKSAAAFSGPAQFAPELARQGQHVAQDRRDEVHRATANAAAAGDDEPAPLRADAPESRVRADQSERPPVAETDPSRPEGRDRERKVDLTA